MNELTHARLVELLSYDPETGVFRWRVNRSNVKAGAIAGTHVSKGYYGIRIDGKLHYIHRLAWFYVTGEWPPKDVDHKNLIRSDNRFDNLRLASSSQNKMNKRAQRNNRLGVKGVSYDHRYDWYQARIKVNGKQKTIGVFKSVDDAAKAYERAANENFGEFARTA